MFSVRMKTVSEFYVFLTGLNGWAFVYDGSGCGIDSCCSYLSFRYSAFFEQGVSWDSDNYRVYIHFKTRLWHDKNTQLKNVLPLYSVLLNYFIYSRIRLEYLKFLMVEQLQSRLARIGSKWFLFILSEKRFLSFKLKKSQQQKITGKIRLT